MIAARRIPLETVAWLAALLPLAAAHLAYLISASLDAVPWCLPHIEGCTSISRAARSTAAASAVYKGLLLPYSVLLALFWWQAGAWLRELAPARKRTQRALLPLGLVAAAATAAYTAALGIDGEVYQWIRRYGINVGFGCTFLAELLLAAALARETRVPQALRRALVGLCAAMLTLGIASIPLQFLTGSHGEALNAIEWNYGLLMLSFFPLAGAAWRRTTPTAPAPS
ncbi:MAG: hypothetical protein ACRETF_05245 [Nevskiaceae bacterium]